MIYFTLHLSSIAVTQILLQTPFQEEMDKTAALNIYCHLICEDIFENSINVNLASLIKGCVYKLELYMATFCNI